MARRSQFNMFVRPVEEIAITENISKAIIPMLWMDEVSGPLLQINNMICWICLCVTIRVGILFILFQSVLFVDNGVTG